MYAEQDDPKRPRVNFGVPTSVGRQCSVELHKRTREPLPPAPGVPAKCDYEYERKPTRERVPRGQHVHYR